MGTSEASAESVASQLNKYSDRTKGVETARVVEKTLMRRACLAGNWSDDDNLLVRCWAEMLGARPSEFSFAFRSVRRRMKTNVGGGGKPLDVLLSKSLQTQWTAERVQAIPRVSNPGLEVVVNSQLTQAARATREV